MAHLIYGLFDPREPKIIKYVGYTGYTAGHRLSQHIVEAKRGKLTHRCNWIRSLLAVGVQPGAIVLEEVTKGNWQNREKHWINVYADTVTNGTAGGEGLVNPSQEVRNRISKTLKESGASLGNQHRKGIAHTKESRTAISEGLRTSEKVKEFGERWKGVDRHSSLTDEQKAARNKKISEAMTGKARQPFSNETKEKMSASHKGIKLPGASAKKQGSRFINDGKMVKQLKAGEPLPEGWVYGMKLKGE